MPFSVLLERSAFNPSDYAEASLRNSAMRGGGKTSSGSQSGSIADKAKQNAKKPNNDEAQKNVLKNLRDTLTNEGGVSKDVAGKSDFQRILEEHLNESYNLGESFQRAKPNLAALIGIPSSIVVFSLLGTALGIWHEGSLKNKQIKKLQQQVQEQDS